MANTGTASLFPILSNLEPSARGMGRIARLGTTVDHGHEVEFRSFGVRSILNKSFSRRRLSFARSINPYRGCEFACRYCYARYTHEFMELRKPEDFEKKIFVKQNAAWLLEQELRRLEPGEEIALGTATDPYQPIERRARVTRSLLEVFATRRGHRLGIVTKSALIVRDIDLLERISQNNELVIHITVTTPDPKLARILEPRAPRPDLRLRTVARLRKAGLRTGVLCSPLLPGLTDSLEALTTMAQRAKDVDASFFAAQPLFLKPCSRDTYLAFIRQHFPALESLYRFRFDGRDFVSTDYAQRMETLVEAVTQRYGLARRSSDALLTRDVGERGREASTCRSSQATLWPERKPAQRAETAQRQRPLHSSGQHNLTEVSGQ